MLLLVVVAHEEPIFECDMDTSRQVRCAPLNEIRLIMMFGRLRIQRETLNS